MEWSPSVPAEKKALRARCGAAVRGLGAETLKREGSAAAAVLARKAQWIRARTVLAFLGTDAEVASDPVVAAALREGKRVALPRVEGGDISFREAFSVGGPWATGPFGIREPPSDAPPIDVAAVPGPLLVIAPGVAFDRAGRRLGHGKGYYDRFLRSLRSLRSDAYVIGLCAGVQLVDRVPIGETDEPMDAVCAGGNLMEAARP